MKNIIKNIWSTNMLMLLVSTVSHATVGGKQYIEFIGLDRTTPKVYLLRHFEDGRGRLPQLYYFNLSKQSPNPARLIQADSVYNRLPHGHQPDYDATDGRFEQKLAAIKQRSLPLRTLPKTAATLEILNRTVRRDTLWIDNPDVKMYRIDYRYCIRYRQGNLTFRSPQQRLTAYGQTTAATLPIIKQLYAIPQQHAVIATVEYVGIPFETGYTMEDAVLLRLSK